ncbi:MAG: hypothetical protein H6837_15115 [Planctomycetes bacterium]|nr:hypothetical protein [Planctomycetota bacterium]
MHTELKDKGLVVLGFNTADTEELARGLMRAKGVSYPCILDGSKAARDAFYRDYRGSGVPLNYLIDRTGKVAEAWYGVRGEAEVRAALRRVGIESGNSDRDSQKR